MPTIQQVDPSKLSLSSDELGSPPPRFPIPDGFPSSGPPNPTYMPYHKKLMLLGLVCPPAWWYGAWTTKSCDDPCQYLLTLLLPDSFSADVVIQNRQRSVQVPLSALHEYDGYHLSRHHHSRYHTGNDMTTIFFSSASETIVTILAIKSVGGNRCRATA